MRKPPKGELWVHIDRLDRDDGQVWAVQVDGKYQTACGVALQAPGHTQFFGTKGRQPRAVIVVPRGSYRLLNGVAIVTQR